MNNFEPKSENMKNALKKEKKKKEADDEALAL